MHAFAKSMWSESLSSRLWALPSNVMHPNDM